MCKMDSSRNDKQHTRTNTTLDHLKPAACGGMQASKSAAGTHTRTSVDQYLHTSCVKPSSVTGRCPAASDCV